MGFTISNTMFIFFSSMIYFVVTIRKISNENIIVNYKEEFIKLLFVFYILMLIGVTLFPISIGGYKQYVSINIHPFEQLIYQIKRMQIQSGDSELFRIKLILKNFGGNFILLFPLGILLPTMFKKFNSIIKIVLFGFLISLFIELMQVIEVLINLSRWNRVFDVDDIILNTIGVLVGYLIYKILKLLLIKKVITNKCNNVTI